MWLELKCVLRKLELRGFHIDKGNPYTPEYLHNPVHSINLISSIKNIAIIILHIKDGKVEYTRATKRCLVLKGIDEDYLKECESIS